MTPHSTQTGQVKALPLKGVKKELGQQALVPWTCSNDERLRHQRQAKLQDTVNQSKNRRNMKKILTTPILSEHLERIRKKGARSVSKLFLQSFAFKNCP